jgi:hypothetical protein
MLREAVHPQAEKGMSSQFAWTSHAIATPSGWFVGQGSDCFVAARMMNGRPSGGFFDMCKELLHAVDRRFSYLVSSILANNDFELVNGRK